MNDSYPNNTLASYISDEKISPVFRKGLPIPSEYIIEIDTPLQNHFLLPLGGPSHIENKVFRTLLRLIEISQNNSLNFSIKKCERVNISHFFKWINFDDEFSDLYCELDINFSQEESEYSEYFFVSWFRFTASIRVDRFDGEEEFLLDAFSDDYKRYSKRSIESIVKKYVQCVEASCNRRDVNAPIPWHKNLPRIKGLDFDDVLEISYSSRDGDIVEKVCDVRVSPYSLTRQGNTVSLRKGVISWISGYSSSREEYINIPVREIRKIVMPKRNMNNVWPMTLELA